MLSCVPWSCAAAGAANAKAVSTAPTMKSEARIMLSFSSGREVHDGEPADLGLAGGRLDVVEVDPRRDELVVAVAEVPRGLAAVRVVVVRQHLHQHTRERVDPDDRLRGQVDELQELLVRRDLE